jgi:uncharacterized RDD family membrane protein YckC
VAHREASDPNHPMTATVHAQTPQVPLWRRLAALVYDLLAVVAIVMVTGLLCQMATRGQLTDSSGRLLTWWYQPVQGAVVSAYFLFSWIRGGQTLGMRPWRIRVTDDKGDSPDLRRSVIRLAVAALPLLLLEVVHIAPLRWALWAPVVGWAVFMLPALFDRRRRALYDIVAGTEIRRLG